MGSGCGVLDELLIPAILAGWLHLLQGGLTGEAPLWMLNVKAVDPLDVDHALLTVGQNSIFSD